MSRTAIMAVVGGAVSELGGGKFANGAVTGAFVHMFNAEMKSILRNYKNDSSILNIMKDGDIVFAKRRVNHWLGNFYTKGKGLLNILNVELAHEHIFYNQGGGANIGYGSGDWMYTENPVDYTFSEVYHVTDTLNRTWFQDAYALPVNYSAVSNNCQDFADYIAANIRHAQGY